MRTYIFFYHDSFESCTDFEMYKRFSVSSSRFDSALKSFCHFLSITDFEFVGFCYSYHIFNGHRTQVRYLSYDDILCLKSITDKKNFNL